MPSLLELCCGTKSISKAMRGEGWECHTVDIDARFAPDTLCDVRDYTPHKRFDFVWASPPCDSFARWQLRGLNKSITMRDGEIDDAMSIVSACSRIAIASGGYWLLESTRGSVPFLRPALGAPIEVGAGSHYIYGLPVPGFHVTPYRGAKSRRASGVGRYAYDARLVDGVRKSLVAHYGCG